jgi:DNA-binding beta-propeller fold protein YncE
MSSRETQNRIVHRLGARTARLLVLLVGVLSVACAAASAASATTWNLANDFPLSSDGATPPANPTGTWAVGWGVSSYAHGPAMASFRLAPSTDWEDDTPANQTAAGVQGWADQQPSQGGPPPYYPYLAKNTSGSNVSGIWPDGVVEGHPAPDTNPEDRAAVAWISPINGTVSISASFISMNGGCGAGLDYSIEGRPAGGSLSHLGGGYFPAGGTGTYDSSSVSVHTGDRYYFSVGDGHQGDYTCDSTQFSIVISSSGGTGGSLVWHNSVTGSGAQALNHPEGVSLNFNDHPASLIIADSGNNRLETSDPFGTSLTTFDGVSLSDPRQAIFANNNFIVSDTNNGRVEQIQSGTDTDGGPFGTANGNGLTYGAPRGIAESSDATRIAVANASSNSVYVLDSGGNLVQTLTGANTSAGVLKNPEGVAFDASNNVWVADTQNHRLVEFSAQDGSVLKTISPSSSFYPTGVAVDPYSGNIWVAAWQNNNVIEFDRTGQVLQMITSANGSSDALNGPVTLAFDPSTGDLYVADESNNRIVHYTGAGQPPVVNTDAVFSKSASDLGVQGRVNPEGRQSTYYVQYGTDQSSMNSYQPAAPQTLADNSNSPYTDTTDHTVQVHLSGLTSGQNYCFRFVAFNAMGASYGATKCANTVAPATVTTDGAISISSSDLDIKGTINPNQTPNLKYYFQLGLDAQHMTTYKPAPPPGTSVGFHDSTSHDFTADFGNLKPATNYCFQVVVTNGVQNFPGGVKCHSTVGPPMVSTDSVFYQDTDRLGVQGTITPNGTPNLSYYVAYGTSASNLNAFYPSQSGTPLGSSDYSGHTVQVFVKNLKPGTQYCLQLVATNGPETIKGRVLCHATTGSPVPLLTTSTPTCSQQHCDWSEDVVDLLGTVNPDGLNTTWYFQISPCRNFQYSGCPSSQQYTLSFPSSDQGKHANPQLLGDTGYSPHVVQATATGLTPGTTYYIRLVATDTSNGHTAYDSGVQSVTTAHIEISANYLGADGLYHAFGGGTPAFDGTSSGIPWNYTCTEVGLPGQTPQYCGYTINNGASHTDSHNLPATCSGPSKCTSTVRVHALGAEGTHSLDATYQYVVNPPPPPPVQNKDNTQANQQITHETAQQCGFFDVVCNGKKLVGGVVQVAKAGFNAVSQAAVAAANAALQFLHDFGSKLNSLAASAKHFLGLLLGKLTFNGRPVGVQIGYDQYGNRYVAAASGYHFIQGTVGNIIGAGGGNIIGAGGGNAGDLSGTARDGQTGGQQAYMKGTGEAIQYAVVNNQTGKIDDIIGAGGGNALDIFEEIIGAGGGNWVSNLLASFSSWFNNHIIGAGGGNIIGAGGGNIIGAGGGNIKGQNGLSIIGAGGGNIIGAGGGNAGDVTAARASTASAGGGLSYGDTPESFSETSGTRVTSTIRIAPAGGSAVVLASGTTFFRMTGKQTMWLAYTRAGVVLLTKTGKQNAARAKKHRRLRKLKFTVVNKFQPAHGRTKTFTHSYSITPKGG